jgi:hypothetical protein
MAKAPRTHTALLPKVSVELDGKSYGLAFDFNALARAEELTGLNMLKALDFQGLSATTFRALLFASLLKLQPEVTLEEVGSLIQYAKLPDLYKAVARAYTESQPEPEPASPNVEQPEQN